MQSSAIKPIFIVGSPRSGTSILTWCLGQHPNILPVPESSWMGEFAVNVAIGYQFGTARADRTILSAMDIQRDEFFASFGKSINDLILRHRIDLERKRSKIAALTNTGAEDFMTAPSAESPKARWVDGTPQYSFHICGLRKLFPNALFIHIVRDVTSVVRSMLNFHRVAGVSFAANEQEAYNHWFRSVSSCLLAERAYGPGVVFRLRYSDVVTTPEAALRSLFDFLGEAYTAKCLEPLARRINSSNVPDDFKADDPATDPAVIEKARRLWIEVEKTPQPSQPSRAATEEMEAVFDERVRYVTTLDSEYCKALQEITRLHAQNQQEITRLQEVIAGLQEQSQQEITRLQEQNQQEITRLQELSQQEITRLQNQNAKNAARTKRLAQDVKGKRAIIEHLRGRRQRYKWRRLLFGRDAG